MRREIDLIEQRCAKALKYPMYIEDLDVFPDATEEDGYFIGEHAGLTIVDELASAYEKLTYTPVDRNIGNNWKEPEMKERNELLNKLRTTGFEHVLNKIVHASKEERNSIYDELLFDKRGTRQGFPDEVYFTILRLFFLDVTVKEGANE